MEIAMELENDQYGDDWYKGGDAWLCPEDLRDEVSLPKKAPKIYAVFTKKSTPDSFLINKPCKNWREKDESRIFEIDNYLMSNTRMVLAQVYNKGFRYVRIEY